MDVFLSVIAVIVALSCLATLMVSEVLDYRKQVIDKRKLTKVNESAVE